MFQFHIAEGDTSYAEDKTLLAMLLESQSNPSYNPSPDVAQ
ncbi:hypothetical protein DsansV1_C01g0004941 [Dioscorea sansibarensis]